MKKMLLIWLLSGMFFSATTAQYDDALPTGYEGDNFSLEGALDLFKNSNSLDQFERKLNTRDNWVNNLDLNFDGRTDYIRVEHRRQGDFHAIILQALVGSWEVQDVAVIEIEKVSRRDAILQIIGDEDLYGEEVIVEAYDRNTLVRERRHRRSYSTTTYVNVYDWSPIQYIFGPRYVVYVSPFHHAYYPTWWSPWNRCGWDVFRPRIRHYHRYYRPVRVHRVRNVHNFYKPHRTYCNTVLRTTNKVRAKHGKRTINRPRVERKNVVRDRGVTSTRSKNIERKDIRRSDGKTGNVAGTRGTRTSPRPNSRGKSATKEIRRSSSYSSAGRTSRRDDGVTKSTRRKTQTKKSRSSERTMKTRGLDSRKNRRSNTGSVKGSSSRSQNRTSTRSSSSRKTLKKQSRKKSGMSASRTKTSSKRKSFGTSSVKRKSPGKSKKSTKKSSRSRRQ